MADPHVADGNRHEQLATTRLLLQGLERTLAQNRQLHLAHRALHAEQQSIVGMARIVDAVLVDDQCADETAELQQRVPVPAVAGEPRRLDRDHGTNATSHIAASSFSKPGRAMPPPERPRSSSMTATSLQPSCARSIGEAVLAALALKIVGDLIGGRLANIDDGLTGEVFRGDLAHVLPPVC